MVDPRALRCRLVVGVGHRVWYYPSWCYDVKMLPCKISYILDRSVGLLWTKNAIQKKTRLKNKPEKQNLNMLKLRQPTHATKRKKVKSKMQAFKRTNKGWQKAKQIHICLSCMFFGVISHGSPACCSDTKAMWIWHFVSYNVVAGAISSGQWISASSSLSITLFNGEKDIPIRHMMAWRHPHRCLDPIFWR